MPSWMLKAGMQHVIGRLPNSYWWNGLFQKYVTRGYYPSRETFLGKLNCCRQHLEYYHKFSSTPKAEFTAIEFGTGAWPIVPLGLYLCGASKISTYDLVPFLRKDTLKRTIELFDEFFHTGELERILPSLQLKRFFRLKELLYKVENEMPAQIMKTLNIHAKIDDARTTTMPEQSVDLIFSTVVFEHIDKKILSGLLAEFKRIASPDSIMSHYIGLSDQHASFDKSITPLNFLKYNERWWRLFNNPITPQSRLRIADYRELFNASGWEIAEERNSVDSSDDLDKIRLAPEFTQYKKEDLLILFSWLVARPI